MKVALSASFLPHPSSPSAICRDGHPIPNESAQTPSLIALAAWSEPRWRRARAAAATPADPQQPVASVIS
jgi:hypothetical protein